MRPNQHGYRQVIRALREKAEGRCTFLNCAQVRGAMGQEHWRCGECGRTLVEIANTRKPAAVE